MDDPIICTEHVGLRQFRLSICALQELPEFADKEVTHLLSIWGHRRNCPATPGWIEPLNHYHLNFDDVEVDSEGCVAPTREDVKEAMVGGEELIAQSVVVPVHLLIHCYAGVSRSTAIALAILMMLYGKDAEDQAVEYLLRIRPQAMPNVRIVREADLILGCGGQLIAAVASSVWSVNGLCG